MGSCAIPGRARVGSWTTLRLSVNSGMGMVFSWSLLRGTLQLGELREQSASLQAGPRKHSTSSQLSLRPLITSALFSSVAQSCPTLCDPMNRSMPGLHVHHQLPESTQTHVHWVSDAIQPSHPLSSPSHPAFNLSQNQGLFKWVSSLHQVAKVLEFQLQHQSLQWTPLTDLL